MTQPQDTGAVPSITLLDILEPHYMNMGFEWGEDARNAAKRSVTYKQLEALMQQRELAARIDEAKHRYVNLILTEPDEFKWRDYTNERIAELKRQQTEVMKGE